jgi:hypothetical protein
MVSDSVKKQTQQIFENIDILFTVIPENEFNTEKGGFMVWKHFYHLVHSLDKNFINPSTYTEPEFHKRNFSMLLRDNTHTLGKDEIYKYYTRVKNKIQMYISGLNEEILDEKITFQEMELSKLELILAQLRHVFYHIGYLHCCVKMEKGETPEYIGLYKAVP